MSSPFVAGATISLQVPVSGRVVACESTLLMVQPDSLLASPPMRHRVKIPIKSEQVGVQVFGDALYEGTCDVLSVGANSVKLAHPPQITRIQRRGALRVPVKLMASLAVPFEGRLLPPAPAEVLDLSPSGCTVVFPMPADVGARLQVELDLLAAAPMAVPAEVRSSSAKITPQGIRYRLGLQIVETPEGDLQKIARYVTDLQRERIRKQGSDV